MTSHKKDDALTLPGAIVIAGIIIAVAILIAFTGGNRADRAERQAEETIQASSLVAIASDVGVDADAFDACFVEGGTALEKANRDLENAIETGGQGTPHSIIITPNGDVLPVSGALPLSQWNQILDGLASGDEELEFDTNDPVYNVLPIQPDEFVRGNPNAAFTLIEYSDANCGFCKQLHGTLKQLINQRDDVQWVYRHFPILSPDSQEKAVAAECVGQLGGADAYWEFLDIILEA